MAWCRHDPSCSPALRAEGRHCRRAVLLSAYWSQCALGWFSRAHSGAIQPPGVVKVITRPEPPPCGQTNLRARIPLSYGPENHACTRECSLGRPSAVDLEWLAGGLDLSYATYVCADQPYCKHFALHRACFCRVTTFVASVCSSG